MREYIIDASGDIIGKRDDPKLTEKERASIYSEYPTSRSYDEAERKLVLQGKYYDDRTVDYLKKTGQTLSFAGKIYLSNASDIWQIKNAHKTILKNEKVFRAEQKRFDKLKKMGFKTIKN